MYKPYSESYLMGMPKRELIKIIRCLEHNCKVEQEANMRQFEMLCEYEQYKCHDLEIDPNDLPEPYEEVVALGKNGGIKIAHYTDNPLDGAMWLDKANKKTNVVKWHYTLFDNND